ncbi:MAG: 16S rRNA (guanine(966)-N(2))-methyltransferase RsmD [Endomicrobium sp.]|nr:16S rRNA (guanine(966)-N(2))-methyltransferase RsmD [Endomicrobium sp.]
MTLKVIAGIMKGKSLKTPSKKYYLIRPMLNNIKKSVFDIIKEKIKNSIFLDLFAGIGSVGLEAVSRGAKRVIFVEINAFHIAIIRENIKILNCKNKTKVIKHDLTKKTYILQRYGKYDIIFIGAPYKDMDSSGCFLTHSALVNIVNCKILKKDALIIVQKHIKTSIEKVKGLACFKIKTYGNTLVSFYKQQRIYK